MAVLDLILLVCFISTGLACEETPVLYNVARRARNIAFQYLINDNFILDGWFSTTTQNITYTMVTNATLPPYGRCGAVYGIYMLGDHPNTTTLPDGQEINVVACLRSSFNVCDIAYNIKIRNCGGELQYYLIYTKRYAGYCFGNEDNPPELASVEGLSDAPSDVVLGNIALTVRLDYELTIDEIGVTENYLPRTVFECGFTQQTEYFYLVEWYANNILFGTLGPSSNVTELLLTDKIITDNGVTLGVNFRCGISVSVDLFGLRTSMKFSDSFFAGIVFRCGISVSVDLFGLRTSMKFSDSFFAGIVFNNLTIHMLKSKPETITFKTTLPIGCEYNRIQPNFSSCAIDLRMFERNYKCGSELQSLYALTGSLQRHCGVHIKTLKKGEPWNPEQEYNITIVTNDENYADQDTFTQEFITENDTINKLWSNYQPESVKVIVIGIAANKNKYCYSHVDPHMKTPDSNDTYEQQEVGYFLLYRNTQYNIEVHTPIGTYIQVKLYTAGLYKGMMNVDIHMSPKDFQRTEGLCGSYDDNPGNDFTTREREDRKNNSDHVFSRTWMLLDNENYFSFNYTQLTAWSEENQIYCFCEAYKPTDIMMKTTCSAKPTENCTVTDSTDVTERFCRIISNVNKRSVTNHLEEQKRRFNLNPLKQSQQRLKRSTADTVNITESEAITVCADVIGNSLVAINFTDFLAPGEIEAKIEQCRYDVLDSNDLSAVSAQFDAINALVSFGMSQDPVYVANNAEQVHAFRQQSCPSNCSSQGTCVNGICQCDTFYHGSSCAIDERDQLAIIDVTGGGVCDLLTSDCTCYSVLTSDLIQAFIFKYSKSNLTIDGNYISTETVTGSGEYMSIFEGIICLPSPSSTDNFVTHYNISISNDGSTFSQPASTHVYDSTCQQYITDENGAYTFSLKAGYCNINGACYAEGDTDMDNNCNICQTSAVNTAWTAVCRNPDDEGTTPSVIGIICGVVGGVGVCIGVIAAVVFTVKKAKSKQSNVHTRDENSPDNPGYDSFERSRSDVARFSASDAACDNRNTKFNTAINVRPSAENKSDIHIHDRIDSATSEKSHSDIAEMFIVNNAACINRNPNVNRAMYDL